MKLQHEKYGVDVIINDIHKNPQCEHGPSVLFERFSATGRNNKYYACSACRIRKLCSFYQPYEGKISKLKTNFADNQKLKNYSRNVFNVVNLSKYFFCVTCAEIYLLSEMEKHSNCTKIDTLSKTNVKFPTKMLKPKDNSKFEAQYLFTDKSTSQIIQFIKVLKAQKILCIGSPRIFEFIKNNEDLSLECLLLDIDERFYSFYSAEEYLKYNLFNHHFFDGSTAINTYKSFLEEKKKMVVLIDPPFGGRMELIANTFRLIEEDWKKINVDKGNGSLSGILVHPYFLERSLTKFLPTFKMLDYQVNYDNHPLYTKGPKGMKNGSAVRLFVNVSPKLFQLPKDEGYILCKQCRRWVHKNNKHCFKCRGCMSKDGNTYVHCDTCQKCVKPSWMHCITCNNCLPKEHNCSEENGSAKCHICGQENHKRADCPERKKEIQSIKKKKKKKHG